MSKIVARCVRCRGEFTEAQIKGVKQCPGCGDNGVPMSPDEDVVIKINWHELRILTIWAENWANRNKEGHPKGIEAVYAIVRQLQNQFPHMKPLTLAGEIRELKEQLPNVNIVTNVKGVDDAPISEVWPDEIKEG